MYRQLSSPLYLHNGDDWTYGYDEGVYTARWGDECRDEYIVTIHNF